MNLSISKSELQRGLARIQTIVEKRNSMPILSNVRMEAVKGKSGSELKLAATDLEVGIHGSHEAKVKKAGGVTVGARKLHEIIRELPDEDVQLSTTDNNYLEVNCARSHFTLAGTAVEEYPTLPGASPKKLVPMQAVVLSQMIERTMYATCADETRYNLNGVYVEVLPDVGKLRMVATDGHRLACVDRTIAEGLEDLPAGIIIPRKGLAELKRLVDEDDADEIELGFEGNSGLARKGDVTLAMRLIEGEFPNYRQVIPKEPGRRLSVASEPFTKALRRVHLLSSQQSHSVKLEVKEGQAVISTRNPDLGEAREEMDVDYAGEEMEIGFNAKYLIEALQALNAKDIILGLQDNLSPVQVRPADDDESLAVVMPMRL
ncbi:MAG: DNA polymerase III subunit beta [Deltaproteobacteria bacterium]|nr:DNA polymerase III subunit beta [Deltaproteobacteria bacterium]